jgi:hypothetical protein
MVDILKELGIDEDGKKRKDKDAKDQTARKVGGITFYVSLFVVSFLGVFNLTLLPGLFVKDKMINWSYFLPGLVSGAGVGAFLIRGKLSVFLHELRHSIMSNIVGNRAKSMKFYKNTGYFQFEYTKKTAHMIAFIALAPYFLPVFTFCAFVVAYTTCYPNQPLMVFVVALGWGIDMVLNFRDISPVQTDITEIKGGYSFGLMYILAINIFLSTLIVAWICDGPQGLKHLLMGLYALLTQIVATFRK